MTFVPSEKGEPTMTNCDYCTDFNRMPELKNIVMYEETGLDGQVRYALDVERPCGYIPEPWRNKPLYIRYCPMCGRNLI